MFKINIFNLRLINSMIFVFLIDKFLSFKSKYLHIATDSH